MSARLKFAPVTFGLMYTVRGHNLRFLLLAADGYIRPLRRWM
jgi:hypothetical protein